MEETSALRESFSMVAQLIGPTKWIQLTQHMQIFPAESFDENLALFKKKYRNIPQRIWMILMHWKLTEGLQAKVEILIDSLHHIDLHWLAVAVQKHLEAEGFECHPESDDSIDNMERPLSRHTTKSRVSYNLSQDYKPVTPAHSITSGSNYNDP